MSKLLLSLAAVASLEVLTFSGGVVGQTNRSPSVSVSPCTEKQLSGRPTLKRKAPTLSNSTPQGGDDTEKTIKKEDRARNGEPESARVESKLTVRFEGLVDLLESDLLKELREHHVQLPKDPTLEVDIVEKASQSIKELLVARGYRHASVSTRVDQVNGDSKALVFIVNQGLRPSIAEFRFDGNEIFSSQELAEQAKLCMTHFERDFYDPEVFEYCLYRLNNFARSRGYLQARLHDPKVEERGADVIITVEVDEGVLYRLGNVEIEGASAFSPKKIRSMLTLNTGDVVDGERLSKWLFEDLKKLYAENGYIQYTAEVTPEFNLARNGSEGIAAFRIEIDEGRRFTILKIGFKGDNLPETELRQLLLIHDGDIYNQTLFEKSIDRLNDTGLFELIDKDKDADFRTNDEEGLVDIAIKLAKRPD